MSELLKVIKRQQFFEQHQSLAYFCLEFVDADLEGLEDRAAALRYAAEVGSLEVNKLGSEANGLLASVDFPWAEVADCANRYFESPYQCKEWLVKMLAVLEADTEYSASRQYL